ncbi:MAG: hypothetical protein OHK0031_01830 [Anaerolineales bacterium]
MRFSIIIPTLNEELLLPLLLGDLQAQTFRDFEIIIADAGSSDRTAEIASALGASLVPGGMPALGRNRGAAQARGEFLLFLDADTRLGTAFLEQVSVEVEERFLDLATCEVVPLSENTFDLLLHEFSNLAVKVAQFADPHAPGFCIIISRRLFRRVGGFDETLKLAEDHDLVRRASKFRPLRVLISTEIQVSVRRLEKEGRIRLVSKYVAAELYRLVIGDIRNDIFEYEFGKFTPEEQVQFEKKVGESRKLMALLRQEYARRLAEVGSLGKFPAEFTEQFATQFEVVKEQIRTLIKLSQR